MDHGLWMRLIVAAACLAGLLASLPARATDYVYAPFAGTPAATAEGPARLYAVTQAGPPGSLFAQSELSLPLPDGRMINMRLIANFADGRTLPDGSHAEIDTWIGRVENAPGAPYAVITWSDDAIFGFIPQPCDANVPCDATTRGYPLRIITRGGQPYLVITSADDLPVVQQSTDAFLLPPAWRDADAKPSPKSGIGAMRTIRLAFGYSQAVADAIGSLNGLYARAVFLMRMANQAMAASGMRVRLQLDGLQLTTLPDDLSPDEALFEASGFDASGSARSNAYAYLRSDPSTDVVVLLRPYQGTACGTSWLNGSGAGAVTVADRNASWIVLQDGLVNGSDCGDLSLAHGLGHILGLAHDTAHIGFTSGNTALNGALPYGRGYERYSEPDQIALRGFATVMAVPSVDQVPVAYFSNPSLLTSCLGWPCGVSGQADGVSAANAAVDAVADFHSDFALDQAKLAPGDYDRDGYSDLFLYDPSGHYVELLNLRAPYAPFSPIYLGGVGAGYRVATTGDFDGDGRTDFVWTSDKNDIYIWFSDDGASLYSYVSRRVGTYPSGWQIAGAGDVNGDGVDDLLFVNPSLRALGYRLMYGAKVLASKNFYGVGAGYYPVAVGDFNGDRKVDIVWTSKANDLYMWIGDGTGFSSHRIGSYPNGWQVVGSGDVDGDGKADLMFANSALGAFGYRIMDGTTTLSSKNFYGVGPGYWVAAIGDYNGDRKADLIWTSNAHDLYKWTGDGTTFVSQQVKPYSLYGATQQVVPSAMNDK